MKLKCWEDVFVRAATGADPDFGCGGGGASAPQGRIQSN